MQEETNIPSITENNGFEELDQIAADLAGLSDFMEESENFYEPGSYGALKEAFNLLDQKYRQTVLDAFSRNLLPPAKLFHDWDCIQEIVQYLEKEDNYAPVSKVDLDVVEKMLPHPNKNYDLYSDASSAALRLVDIHKTVYLAPFNFDPQKAEGGFEKPNRFQTSNSFKAIFGEHQFGEKSHAFGVEFLEIYSKHYEKSKTLRIFLNKEGFSSKKYSYTAKYPSGSYARQRTGSISSMFYDGCLEQYNKNTMAYPFVVSYFLPALIKLYTQTLKAGTATSTEIDRFRTMLEEMVGENLIPARYQELRYLEQNQNLLDSILSNVAERAEARVLASVNLNQRLREKLTLLLEQLARLGSEKEDCLIDMEDEGCVHFFEYMNEIIHNLLNKLPKNSKSKKISTVNLTKIEIHFEKIGEAMSQAYAQLVAMKDEPEFYYTLFATMGWLLESCFDAYRVAVPTAVRADICARRVMPSDFQDPRLALSENVKASFVGQAANYHPDIESPYESQSTISKELAAAQAEVNYKIKAYVLGIDQGLDVILTQKIDDSDIVDKLYDLKNILKEIQTPQDLMLKMQEQFVPIVIELYKDTTAIESSGGIGSFFRSSFRSSEDKEKIENRANLCDSFIQFLANLVGTRKDLNNTRLGYQKHVNYCKNKEGKSIGNYLKDTYNRKLEEDFGEDFFLLWAENDTYEPLINVLIKIDPETDVYTFCQIGEEGQITKEFYAYLSGNKIDENVAHFSDCFEQEMQQIHFGEEDNAIFYRLLEVERSALDKAVTKWNENFDVRAYDPEHAGFSL